LADDIEFSIDAGQARRTLGVAEAAQYVALLPGSRHGEVARLGPDFAATVAWLRQQRPALQFLAAMANSQVRAVFEAALAQAQVLQYVRLFDGHSQQVMAASDAVLLASGTATLEATLVKRPMVVAYRLGVLTSFLLRRLGLFKAPFFAQPNLLAGRAVVPEFFNGQVRADVLGPAILQQLERSDRAELIQTFTQIHQSLRRDASVRAAEAIDRLLKQRNCAARDASSLGADPSGQTLIAGADSGRSSNGD
jgi:lipid-A-disaccharide synthase